MCHCSMGNQPSAAQREHQQQRQARNAAKHGDIGGAVYHQQRANQIHQRRVVKQERAAFRAAANGNVFGAMEHSQRANQLQQRRGPRVVVVGQPAIQPQVVVVAPSPTGSGKGKGKSKGKGSGAGGGGKGGRGSGGGSAPPQVALPPSPPVATAGASSSALMSVTVPDGVAVGEELQVQTPDGQMQTLTVPEGLIAGQALEVGYTPLAQQDPAVPADGQLGMWTVVTEEGIGCFRFYPFKTQELARRHLDDVWHCRILVNDHGEEQEARGWNPLALASIRKEIGNAANFV